MGSLHVDRAFDVAVVGAGAAGQMAAIAAAEEGRRVVLLEQMDRPGLKILASGGGRCNLTNLAPPAEFRRAFSRQGRFTSPAMEAMGPKNLRRLLEQLGVPTVVCDGVQVYPASHRAADVQAALRRRMEQLGVVVCLGCAVEKVWIDAGRLMGVETAAHGRIVAGRVVLACGGKSWPTLGGTGGGYALARQAGLIIREPLPALVPLVTRQRWPGRLAGVSLHDARVWIDARGEDKAGRTGDILLTHRGLSGPAVLDISGRVAELLRRGPVPLKIELVAGMDAARWVRRLEDWRRSAGRRGVAGLLQDHLPRSLCEVLCELAGVKERTSAAHLPAAERDALAKILGGLELTVTATEGFGVAFVTRGGVDLKGVEPDTLQSRTLEGLFLAGEMLDLDGPSGGFNLQWAFASGWLAGKSAARP
jgi:predicted Rossmann fold flavoprotein